VRLPIGRTFGLSLVRVRWWAGVGAWAMADQALVAIANFVFNILLARWLDPAEYGVFAAGYALLWLGWAFYKGLLLDPAMVFSSNRFRDQLRSYHSSLLIGHGLLSVVFACAFTATGVATHLLRPGAITLPWLVLAVAGPIIFLPALLRGLCRARLQTFIGAMGAALYVLTMMAGALVAYRMQLLSAATGFTVLAAASAASAALVTRRLGLSLRGVHLDRNGIASHIAVEHWRFGRWLVGANLLSWMPANIWYAALPVLTGAADAGVLRALSNLAQPLTQSYGVGHSILIPVLVQAEANGRFRSAVNLALAMVIAASVAFALAVGVAVRPLIHFFYGGRYAAQIFLVWPIMLRTILMGVSVVQSAALQALQRADWLMAAFAMATPCVLLVGLPATAIWGVTGAVYGQLLAELTVVLSQAWWLHSHSPALARPRHPA
jgi:O-antigen/teichoic acid export membrane protein